MSRNVWNDHDVPITSAHLFPLISSDIAQADNKSASCVDLIYEFSIHSEEEADSTSSSPTVNTAHLRLVGRDYPPSVHRTFHRLLLQEQ